jgi:hypothetical protein
MPVLNRRVPVINSFTPPPAKITAPVSPSYPCRRWSPSAPTTHTITLLVPSMDVTKGEPRPLWVTLQALVMVGGLVGLIAESGEGGAAGAKSNKRALVGPISSRCLDNRAVGNMQRSHGRGHTTEVAAINQICIAIFAQCQHQTGRRGAGHIQEHWAGAAKIDIPVIEA